MQYQQYRPLTKRLLRVVKSIIMKDFTEYLTDSQKIIDLCCGKGGFAIDVRSYVNTSYIVGVDTNISLLKSFGKYLDQKNIKHKLFCLDVFKFKFNTHFDIILIDPPFKFDLCTKLLATLHKKPIVTLHSLIIIRNLAKNKINIDPNIYDIFHDIIIGQNQLIFIKLANPDNASKLASIRSNPSLLEEDNTDILEEEDIDNNL